MESSEARLWQEVRGKKLGTRFRRQHPLRGYIVDFVALTPRLIVELDGDGHEPAEIDTKRDGVLTAAGFRVFRFWNWEVRLELDHVLDEIRRGLVDPGYERAPTDSSPF